MIKIDFLIIFSARITTNQNNTKSIFMTMNTLPWTEKYRPSHLDDVISHQHIIEALDKYISKKSLPHLLFHGSPGVGKTSVILACVKKLYKDLAPLMVLEINASEERGIDVVRNRITGFVSGVNVFSDKDDVQFKLVILDEADAMTPDAQSMLRRVIEKNSNTVRFCLICNHIKKIDPAIQSRCTSFRFSPLKQKQIKQVLKHVAEVENMKLTLSGYDAITHRSNGDMRKALNIMQSLQLAYGKDTINESMVNEIIGYPQRSEIASLVTTLTRSSFITSYHALQELLTNGYSLSDIVTDLHEYLITSDLNENYLLHVIRHLQKIQMNLSVVCNNYNIQIAAVVGAFCLHK